MYRKSIPVKGLDTNLYDGDIVTVYEYDDHFILRYGWTIIDTKPYHGWYLRSLKDFSKIIQAASINLSLASVYSRNDRPSYRRHS